MTVIKSTISSVNTTIQKVNQNEKILKENLDKLANYTSSKLYTLEEEVEHILNINEQIRVVQRGVDESQHSFELLLDAFVHAAQGMLQPQLITSEKIKNIMHKQTLPGGLDYPNFPFAELQSIIIPHTFSYKQYLVYVLDVPLLSPTTYHLYKILPYPVKKEKQTYVFISSTKEYIVSDPVRQHYRKMSTNELTECFHPNEIQFVCKESIPLYAYIPDVDCEATLLHPSTTHMPNSCEVRVTTLEKTFWIPLHLSNEWLYVAPKVDKLTVLCGSESKQVTVKNEGKLTLNHNCKAFSAYVTLYAMNTVSSNVTTDFMPAAPINFDCCFNFEKIVDYDKIQLNTPLVNLMSSLDDLRLASIKVEEVDQLIKEQEGKDYSQWFVHSLAWGSVVSVITIIVFTCCCCFCCCKRCRDLTFLFWDKCIPRKCWKETSDRLCVNINNYSASDRVIYSRSASQGQLSRAESLQSLPPIDRQPTPIDTLDGGNGVEERLTIIPKIKMRSRVFR